MAVLALGRRLHLAAQLVGNQLQAIANPQDRQAQREHALIKGRRIGVVYRAWAAGKDDSDGVIGLDLLDFRSARKYYAKDTLLANPAGDELRVLPAEVEDDNGLGFHAIVSPNS